MFFMHYTCICETEREREREREREKEREREREGGDRIKKRNRIKRKMLYSMFYLSTNELWHKEISYEMNLSSALRICFAKNHHRHRMIK